MARLGCANRAGPAEPRVGWFSDARITADDAGHSEQRATLRGTLLGGVPMTRAHSGCRSPCEPPHCGARDVVTFCLGHLIFGVVAGSAYGLLHATLTGSAIV